MSMSAAGQEAGQAVLVTGGFSGLGAAVVAEVIKAGCWPYVIDLQ